MGPTSQSQSAGCRIIGIILIIILLILLYLWWRNRQPEPEPDQPVVAAQFASGWSVKNNADWTPFPPSPNPLGAPNDVCTGGSIPGSWAEFTFPAHSLPAGATITGIEVRMKYLSQSGTNSLRLTKSGTLIGNTLTQPLMPGDSRCSNTTWGGVGGTGELWGAGLTAADFNAGSVGVRITQGANDVAIDSVELKVYYTP